MVRKFVTRLPCSKGTTPATQYALRLESLNLAAGVVKWNSPFTLIYNFSSFIPLSANTFGELLGVLIRATM
jgi:hypothetical protein